MTPTKICHLCNTEKPISEFRVNQLNGKEYVRYACRPCDNKRHRKYEKEHQRKNAKLKNQKHLSRMTWPPSLVWSSSKTRR